MSCIVLYSSYVGKLDMKKIVVILLLLAFALMLVACGSKSSNDLTEIYISGSKTVEPLVVKLASEFEINYPDYKIIVEGVGSSAGVANTSRNNNNIGMSSRSINIEERENVEPFLLCRDPIVLIVNKDTALDKISKEELVALYVENTPVQDITHAISREERSSTRWAFAEITGIGEELPLLETIEIQEHASAVKTSVIDDASKLGYISFSSFDDTVKALSYSDSGRYVSPSVANVQNGTYALYRPFYLVIPKGTLVGTTQMFLDFCRSEKGRAIMLENGFIPLG